MRLKIKLNPLVLVFMLMISIGGTSKLEGAMKEELIIFAAASTTNVMQEVVHKFEIDHECKLKLVLASSSTLAKQIANGAPSDIYISANKYWMDYLEKRKVFSSKDRFDFLSNRIVFISPKGSPLTELPVDPKLDLGLYLKEGRLSMGDPLHVPVGIYAKQAFKSLGIWNKIKKRIAPARDVRAALSLVEQGEVSLGVVYATDAAISSKVKIVGWFPENSHSPILYPAAMIQKSNLATNFLNYLRSSDSRAIFIKYGFKVL